MDFKELEEEEDFYKKLGEFLSPSQPIQTPEHLKGREEELNRVMEALRTRGRHVFIFGVGGVGKTSLATTAAYLSHPSDSEPQIVSCDPQSTPMEFFEQVARKLGNISYRLKSITQSLDTSAQLGGLALRAKEDRNFESIKTPRSVDEAVSQIQEVVANRKNDLVLVVDEFDRPTSEDFRVLFGDFIKQLSDRRVPVRLIVCGVGSSLEDLLAGHRSAFRYICDVELQRLPFQARIDIIESACTALNFEVDRGFVYRICHLSDGFAHFVHLVTRQLFIKMRYSRVTKATFEEFNGAVHSAILEVNVVLRMAYERATEKYSNKSEYEAILWGMADSPELKRRSADVYTSASRITQGRVGNPLERRIFNTRLNSLKQESHGRIVTGSRAGWYEFRETMMRGYCRLRAQESSIVLDADTFNELNERPGPALMPSRHR